MNHRPAIAFTAAGTFVLLAAAANWLSAHFHQIEIGPLAVAAGTFAAGLVLLVRDAVHDLGGIRLVLACIAAGGIASLVTAGPALAVASLVAFTVAELADLAVYQPLRSRGWGRAAFWSGVAGAIVDTVLFLWLSPFPLTAGGVGGQVAVKISLTAVIVAGVVKARALLRDPVHTASA